MWSLVFQKNETRRKAGFRWSVKRIA